nr:M20 family metallo-hydrolase [Neobacillus sp. Marseille-Q6967]
MREKVFQLAEELYPQMIEWRRDFHQYAESGWVEFRTASFVAQRLSEWGYEIKLGREVVDEHSRMGVPPQEFLKQQEQRAIEQGANPKWVQYFSGGFTGVVGIIDTKKPGKTIGFRFDMDALDLQESYEPDHLPVLKNFVSVNKNMMHACGHDAHTSIGLGLAKLLSTIKDQLTGKIKIIFQPSEEGVRGAKSMVEAGVVDDIDVFIASHVGTGVPLGEFVCGENGFLATTKLDATFIGKASHAGAKPEEGKNALLAAASAALGLHSIPRHSSGDSRINVGVLQAGSGRNVIPGTAHMKMETRGESTEINEYMLSQAKKVLRGAAAMYDVEVKMEIVGEAKTSKSSEELLFLLEDITSEIPEIEKVTRSTNGSSGSEDATYMMERVKKQGGLAAYSIFGTTLAAGHHNEKFDIDEKVLKIAVKTLANAVIKISSL